MRIHFPLWALLLLLGYTAQAQQTFTSLEELWDYATVHNINLQLATSATQRAQLSHKQAYSNVLPQVSLNSSFTSNEILQTTLLPKILQDRTAQPGEVIPVQFGQKYIYNAGITGQIDILNLSNWLQIKTSNISAAISKDSLANNKKLVYQQLATQYYNYLLMQKASTLAVKSEQIADSIYQSVTYKFTVGTANKAQTDVAKINLNKANLSVINAQYQLSVALNNIKNLLNIPLEAPLTLTATLSELEENYSTLPFAQDPTIAIAQKQEQISLLQYKNNVYSFLPILSVQYSTSKQQNNNEFQPLSSTPTWFPAQFWTLKASWLLFNSGSRYFNLQKSKITTQERKWQVQAAENQSVLADENLKLALYKAKATLEKGKENMGLSFDNYSHISNKYEEGLASLDDRLSAFNDYLTYQNQYLSNLADLLVQQYQMKLRYQNFN